MVKATTTFQWIAAFVGAAVGTELAWASQNEHDLHTSNRSHLFASELVCVLHQSGHSGAVVTFLLVGLSSGCELLLSAGSVGSAS